MRKVEHAEVEPNELGKSANQKAPFSMRSAPAPQRTIELKGRTGIDGEGIEASVGTEGLPH
jgi:hypothetical protein